MKWFFDILVALVLSLVRINYLVLLARGQVRFQPNNYSQMTRYNQV